MNGRDPQMVEALSALVAAAVMIVAGRTKGRFAQQSQRRCASCGRIREVSGRCRHCG